MVKRSNSVSHVDSAGFRRRNVGRASPTPLAVLALTDKFKFRLNCDDGRRMCFGLDAGPDAGGVTSEI